MAILRISVPGYGTNIGNVIENNPNFFWDDTNHKLVLRGDGFGSATHPSLAFGDGNTGFYESADNTLVLTVGGSGKYAFTPLWATIGFSTFVKASILLGAAGVVVLALGHWLADAIWYGFLAYMVDKGKNYMNDKMYQNIIRFFSFTLIVLGISFIINYK